MATPTRVSPPGSIHLVTHRTTQGEFILRPDRALTQNTLYLLGYMQQCYFIDLHTACSLSNHIHLLFTDRLGDQLQPFNQHFFSLMGRSTNCYRGRSENLWCTRKPNCVLVAPRAEDIVDKSRYVNANPVEAELVSHAKKWPGLRVLASEMGRLELVVDRPEFFYDPNGDMPKQTAIRFTLPRVWDAEPEELRLRITQECNRCEAEIRDRVEREGRTFLGVKRVLRVSARSKPKNRQTWFERIPNVACKDKSLRVRFIEWRADRQRRYDELRKLLLEGARNLVFPEGTFALHFRCGQAREPWSGCIWRRLASET